VGKYLGRNIKSLIAEFPEAAAARLESAAGALRQA